MRIGQVAIHGIAGIKSAMAFLFVLSLIITTEACCKSDLAGAEKAAANKISRISSDTGSSVNLRCVL